MTVAHFNIDHHFQPLGHIAAFPFNFEWRNCHYDTHFRKLKFNLLVFSSYATDGKWSNIILHSGSVCRNVSKVESRLFSSSKYQMTFLSFSVKPWGFLPIAGFSSHSCLQSAFFNIVLNSSHFKFFFLTENRFFYTMYFNFGFPSAAPRSSSLPYTPKSSSFLSFSGLHTGI